MRFLQGGFADLFLWRSGVVPGYAVAIWKHQHVAEPTQLPAEQAVGFWLDTLRAGAAIERHRRPVKLNYLTLGNALPHLHTHIVPRYADDPVPGTRCRSTSSTTGGSPKTASKPTRWRCGGWWTRWSRSSGGQGLPPVDRSAAGRNRSAYRLVVTTCRQGRARPRPPRPGLRASSASARRAALTSG
jgi:diadenosine tetraphosphate (Ap4A) HIT family hydrolase